MKKNEQKQDLRRTFSLSVTFHIAGAMSSKEYLLKGGNICVWFPIRIIKKTPKIPKQRRTKIKMATDREKGVFLVCLFKRPGI